MRKEKFELVGNNFLIYNIFMFGSLVFVMKYYKMPSS